MPSLSHAVSLLQAGDTVAAQEFLSLHPEDTAHHAFLLGACAHAQDRIAEAVTLFSRALQRNPAHAQAACALGSLYAGLGRHTEAEALFRETLTRIDDAQLRFNLAATLEENGKLDEALSEYTELIKRHNHHYAARHNRAGLLARHNRLNTAAEDYRVLVKQYPQDTMSWHKLGELELGLGHYSAATALLQTVLQREPGNGKAMLSLALALAANGDIEKSRQFFTRLRDVDNARWSEALERVNNVRGHDTDIDPRLIFLLRQQEHLRACNWREWPLYAAIFHDFIQRPSAGECIGLAYISMGASINAQEQLRLMQHIAAQVQRRVAVFSHAPSPTPKRLRIAYSATRFGHHVTGLLFRHFFAAHNQKHVEVFVISLGKDDSSDNIKTIQNTTGINWVDLSDISDEVAAAHIKALNLDIIIDLASYNDGPRPEVLAQRPAPIQVNWQGGAYSSGSPWLDYIISDKFVSPGGNWCSEAEVHMPGSYFLCSNEGVPPAVPARESLGLPADKFVFCCLNVGSKIEPDVFSSWMRILLETDDSVLWLLGANAAQIANLQREAKWRDIDPQRLIFAGYATPAEHIARMGAADLFLDTRYFNGHTTITESLWAGTPALTCPGQTFASRVGASIVASCDLQELIMPTWEAYEAKAIELFRHPATLLKLRDRLSNTRLNAPSFDLHQQATHLEKAYRHMRDNFANGLAPTAFNVADIPD
jgi:protein O-GlcNAc transferase